MAKIDFTQWPTVQTPPRKPFDRLMPFHRIRVPVNQIVLSTSDGSKIINGDGYAMGARSTKDYDGNFGKEIGEDLAELLEGIFPVLLLGKALTKALAALLGKIPGLGKVAEDIDKIDPLKIILGKLGAGVDSLLIDTFVHSIPAWVPTTDDQTKVFLEVDGILIRSHQRINSIPFAQWHRWYDWRFAICASPIFIPMVGFGSKNRDNDNTLGLPDGVALTNYLKEGLPTASTISADVIVECEWDIGAIGMRETAGDRPKFGNKDRMPAFFDEIQPRVKHDWCWPMTGMFFWAIGRSVYDCAHSSADGGRRAKGAKKPSTLNSRFDDKKLLDQGVHINQIHPPKAIATARWEAHQFPENPQPVPALQFMFYANAHLSSAGFFDPKDPGKPPFTPLNDQDYDFIIDLPPAVVTAKSEYPVGHTPDFAGNTLVLLPRLVVDPQFKSFAPGQPPSDGIMEDAADRRANPLKIATDGPKPIVALIGGKPGEPPKQAVIRIPLTQLAADRNAYGVLVSVGWFDPDAIQATKVKKVTVRLIAVQPDLQNLDSDDNWNLNIGVNGRWFNFRFRAKESDTLGMVHLENVTGGQFVKVDMELSEDDFIMVSAHGFEEDPLDDVMRLKPEFTDGPRPAKKAPQLQKPGQPLTPAQILQFKKDSIERTKVFSDRILRNSTTVDIPTGTPDAKGKVPSKAVTVPFIGDEIEWDKHIDTDDNAIASLTGRAMFLRLAVGNRFDANDLLGMLDANMADPLFTNPFARRRADGTDTANPLVVSDVVKEVGIGKPKLCRVTAYKSTVIGRTEAMAYDPNKVDYTLHYEVIVDDLPADAAGKK